MATLEKTDSEGSGGSRDVVAILGMHRSGTSLAAIVARELGVAMGQDLIPANDFNQDGYAEDVYIVQQHDKLMAALGRPWNTIRGTLPLPVGWTESAEFENARDNLAAYLSSEFSRIGNQIWAVKDPRISILAPLWQRLARDLDFRLLPVLCIRSSNAVAASLEKRDAMPADIGRLVWLQYNAAIVKNIGERVAAVLSYDSWFSTPNRNLAVLSTILGKELIPAVQNKILEEVVSSDLRHYPYTPSSGVFGLWESLLEQWATEQSVPVQLKSAKGTRFWEFLQISELWRCAIVDENPMSKIIDGLRYERDQVVAAADENLKAYRTISRERDHVIAVANENLKAYRTVDAALNAARVEIALLHAEVDRQQRVISRFDWFPLSLMKPSARKAG